MLIFSTVSSLLPAPTQKRTPSTMFRYARTAVTSLIIQWLHRTKQRTYVCDAVSDIELENGGASQEHQVTDHFNPPTIDRAENTAYR